MKTIYVLFAAIAVLSCVSARAASVLFDFENAQVGSSLPLNLSVDGLTASLSATGFGGFYIQQPQNTILMTPPGFSGNALIPTSTDSADLHVGFSKTLTDFSILFAPQELALDTTATMKVTAFRNGVSVGTSTSMADPPGTWPSGTLSISSAQGFNSVVVHYDKPPLGATENWGAIFVADNMNTTLLVLMGDYNQNGTVDAADYVLWRKNPGGFPADAYATWRSHFGQPPGSGAGVSANTTVPEPATLVLLMFAAAGWCLRRRRDE